MSTNNGGGGDGLGGDGVALQPRDGDEILEDPTYNDGDEFEIDPELTVPVGDGMGGGRQEQDPFAGWSDEARQLAVEKGWKGPEDAAKAYQGAQQLIGKRESEESRALQDRIAQLEGQLRTLAQPAPQHQEPGGDDYARVYEEITAPVDWGQLMEAADHDPGRAMALYHEHIIQPRLMQGLRGLGAELLDHVGTSFESEFGRRVAPLETGMTRISVRDQAAQLASQFPKDFPRLQAEVSARVQRNPAVMRQPGGLRTVFNEVLAEDYARRQREEMAQEGETLTGGRGPARGRAPEVDVDAEIRAGVEAAGRPVFDGL